MSKDKPSGEPSGPKPADGVRSIDLRDPLLAAFLAWLIPGLGHIYQRRTAKGVLFMVCILGTFLYGWGIGGGKVVYAAWEPEIRRWPYLCQVWIGLPAMPAIIQSGLDKPLGDSFMAAPDSLEELNSWHLEYNAFFELGTVFTMIAGLLNLLAIFDAGAGPVGSVPEEEEEKEKEKKKPTGRDPDRPPPEDKATEATAAENTSEKSSKEGE